MPRLILASPLLIALTLVAGCDMFGGDSAEKLAASKEAEGRAIGGACRHAGRAIEDCYSLNRKADKASIFAGWRDMNDYMRENKIEPVAPQLPTQLANAKTDSKNDAKSESKGESKVEARGESKAVATDATPEGIPTSDKRPAKASAKPRDAKDAKHES
jgi:hypothetical protein